MQVIFCTKHMDVKHVREILSYPEKKAVLVWWIRAT